jgi:acetyltransferase-like isoleucine patch superfamily enzyme
MSSASPPSVNLGPITTNNLFYSKYIIIYILELWLGAIPVVFWGYICYLNLVNYWWSWFLIPLFALELYWMYIIIVSWVAKILLVIVCKLYPPREGVFKIDETKDYFYWNLRIFIRSLPFTLIRYSAFPWLDFLVYNFLSGSKFNKCGMSSVMYDGWIDTEFIETGNNCMIGLGSIVLSHYIDGDLFILKKVKLNDGAIVGAKAIVMPGTEIGKHTTLGAASLTEIDQHLEDYSIYMGMPAKKLKKP